MQKKKYTIFRIINNNVVTSVDEQSSEIVLMGKGISFKKKVGEVIEDKDIEKVFVLRGKEIKRYLDIIEHIPIQYFDVATAILEMAETELNMKSNPIGFIMLADHIASAIDRANENIFLENEMLEEIRFFYPKEFEIGVKALDIVTARFHIELPVDEAGFIAFHIVNLSEGSIDGVSRQRIMMINKVVELTERYFKVKIKRDTIYFERFLTHLKYFFIKNRADSIRVRQSQGDDFLYDVLKNQYPEVAKCAALIQEYLKDNYQIEISNEEKELLIMHIKNLFANGENEAPDSVREKE